MAAGFKRTAIVRTTIKIKIMGDKKWRMPYLRSF